MKRYYCTYFNSNYLPHALSLLESLNRVSKDAELYMFCMDELSYTELKKRDAENAVILSYKELEDEFPNLTACKSNRTAVEYFYTCSPAICYYVLKKFSGIDLVTYLDADLYFFSSPEPLFDELADNSVGIIEHKFYWAAKRNLIYGRFNVGWINFRNDEIGLRCLTDWMNNCINWCYQRLEDGKYADQKYLDNWVNDYSGVKIIENIGANLGVWNLGNYSLKYKDGEIFVNRQKLIFYHFASLRQISNDIFITELSKVFVFTTRLIRDHIYMPYIRSILNFQIASITPKYEYHKNKRAAKFKHFSRAIRRLIFSDKIHLSKNEKN